MRRVFAFLLAVSSCTAATTITATFCSGNRASVSWIRYDINGAQIGQSGPVSWTSGTYTEALEPGTDGSRYFVTVVCPSGGVGTQGYWLIPDTVSTLTVSKVAVSPNVKITDGWYWDTVSETWKNVAAGISAGGGGGAVSSVFSRTGAVVAQSGDYTAAQVTGAEATANKNAASGYAGLDASGRIAKAQGHAAAVYTDQTNTYILTKQDFGPGILEIPNGTTLPATCVVGEQFMDTDAPTTQRHYLCEAANSWVPQGSGAASSFPVTTLTTQSVTVAATTISATAATNRVTLGAVDITITNTRSIAAGTDGQRLNICNRTTANPSSLFLQDESLLTGSGVLTGTNDTVKIEPGRCAEFQYDSAVTIGSTTGFWLYIGENVFYQPGPPLGLQNASIQSDDLGNNAVWTFKSIYPSTTAFAVTADNAQIPHGRKTISVNPDAHRTLTSTATITDGRDGEELKICNVSATFRLTFQDESVLPGSNLLLRSSTLTLLPNGDCVTLWYSNDAVAWVRENAARQANDSAAVFTLPYGITLTGQVVAPTSNVVRVRPFYLPMRTAVGRISINISTLVNPSLTWVGIYSLSGNRLITSGGLNSSTTGLKTQTFTTVMLEPGYYLAAWSADSNTVQATGAPGSNFMRDAANQGTSKYFATAANNITAGDLPLTLGLLTADTGNDSALAIALGAN